MPRDIKQASGGAGVLCSSQDAGGVLHGHVVATERTILAPSSMCRSVRGVFSKGADWSADADKRPAAKPARGHSLKNPNDVSAKSRKRRLVPPSLSAEIDPSR